jgi:hypothetical protein
MISRYTGSRTTLLALFAFPALLACSPGGSGDSPREEAFAREVGTEAPGTAASDVRATEPVGEAGRPGAQVPKVRWGNGRPSRVDPQTLWANPWRPAGPRPW